MKGVYQLEMMCAEVFNGEMIWFLGFAFKLFPQKKRLGGLVVVRRNLFGKMLVFIEISIIKSLKINVLRCKCFRFNTWNAHCQVQIRRPLALKGPVSLWCEVRSPWRLLLKILEISLLHKLTTSPERNTFRGTVFNIMIKNETLKKVLKFQVLLISSLISNSPSSRNSVK